MVHLQNDRSHHLDAWLWRFRVLIAKMLFEALDRLRRGAQLHMSGICGQQSRHRLREVEWCLQLVLVFGTSMLGHRLWQTHSLCDVRMLKMCGHGEWSDEAFWHFLREEIAVLNAYKGPCTSTPKMEHLSGAHPSPWRVEEESNWQRWKCQ